MKQYALLRILLACFLLYIAWPSINENSTQMDSLFWAGWLVFFLLVVGSNLATLLQMVRPPAMEVERKKQYQTAKN